MKKFKINVQGYGCILLCLILCIMILLPIPVSAQEDRSKVVRVGWYEGTYNTSEADGQRRGYSYEYQQAVAAHTGWKYEYVEGSWAELMSMLKKWTDRSAGRHFLYRGTFHFHAFFRIAYGRG